MTFIGWLQISLLFLAVLAVVKPLGIYMARVFSGDRTLLSPVLAPVERGLYRLAGVDADKEQGWLSYTLAMLAFSLAGFVALYAILRLQAVLPFNPQGFPAVPADLAFITAVSFVTNTNWQNYAGEATMSHFSQMAGLTVQNFLSAATGMALAIAVTRAFARSKIATLGNFFVDLTRATLYVLLPIALVVALAFVAMGLPQTLEAGITATTLEGAKQTISLGRSPARRPSSSSAPMVAASSTPMPPTRSKTPMPGRTISTSSPCSRCRPPSSTPSGRWWGTAARAGRCCRPCLSCSLRASALSTSPRRKATPS
jgi:K+-transporting ATPase ATPase A chain